jgi:hypothetical protein
MATRAEEAVRSYLVALKDPSALRDEEGIAELERKIDATDDQLERVLLRQRLLEAKAPTIERYEEEFVTHAKAWADEQGVSASAFAEEGVPAAVLRRAGFRVGGGGRRAGRSGGRSGGGQRSRVTADEVRAEIPKGSFTIKVLQERSGASPAVVRKVVQEELGSGALKELGADPDHSGPGRAPTLYQRA